MEGIASLTNVSKRFGQVEALDCLSLAIPFGTTALLGRNGAGKSTLLNLLTGVVFPSEGDVLIEGNVAGSNLVVSRVARQLEFPGSATNLNRRRIVRILEMTAEEADHLRKHMHAFEVPDLALGKMSRGNQVKFALAVTFARDRELLLLDEPTTGLDPFALETLIRLIERRAESGKSTLIATHQPTLTPNIFDRVIVLDSGRLEFVGRLDELLSLGEEAGEVTSLVQFATALSILTKSGRRQS